MGLIHRLPLKVQISIFQQTALSQFLMENMQLGSVKLPSFDLINVLTGKGIGREYYSPNAIDTQLLCT